MRAVQGTLVTAVAVALLAGPASVVSGQSEASAQPTASAVISPVSSGEPSTGAFVGTAPPNGTYQADISADDLLAKGASTDFAEANQGTWTWTFADGSFSLVKSGMSAGCSGTYESLDGVLVRLTTTMETDCSYQGDIVWAPAPEGIRVQGLPSGDPPDVYADMIAYWDRVFASLPTIGTAADDGARIVAVDTIDARTRDLTIASPSVGTVQVRLLLPAGFEAEPDTTWPVLYLLHGAWGDHTDWTDLTDVAALTAPTDLLVVMPDAATGWYTDAWNGGAGGPPAWETFHTIELLQLLERNWQAGPDRVVAGLSMGGLGAIDYAARHPGLFKAAASFSGVMDIVGSELDNGVTTFGDPVAQADKWRAHNPLDVAPALEGIPLYVSYGDGQPGPLDPPGTGPSDLEQWIAPQNEAFVARLQELGIPATVDAYGPGTHDWPYWERALHGSLPMLLEALGG